MPCDGPMVKRGGRMRVCARMAPQSAPIIDPSMMGEGSAARRKSVMVAAVVMSVSVQPSRVRRVVALE